MRPKLNLMIVCFTGNSGLTDYSVSLCRELHHDLDLLFVTAESFESERYGAEFKTIRLFRRTRHFPLDVWRFIWLVVKERPRTLLFQSWLKSPLLESLMVNFFRGLGIQVCLAVHDLLPHYPRLWSRWACALYYRRFQKLIVHSVRQENGLRAMGVKAPVLCVPHGVYDIFNTDNLSMSAARSFFPEIQPADKVFLFFGHLDERKGVVEFLQAADALRDRTDLKFMVAGKPDGRAATTLAVKQRRDHPNLVLHDRLIPHEQVQRYFAACDFVVLPYLEGSTSGVMKLAIAFKKPVICTDIGDFPETLEAWPGVMVTHDLLPGSLVEGIDAALAQMADLGARTDGAAEEMRWPKIANRYRDFLLTAESDS